MYRPLTGQPCTCEKGLERDNCSLCEGTGAQIDFAKIRQMNEMVRVEVVSIRRLEGAGNLLAFVDIRVGGALVINKCTIMTGRRGLFFAFPRQLSRDGRWYDMIISTDADLVQHYSEVVIREYELEVSKINA